MLLSNPLCFLSRQLSSTGAQKHVKPLTRPFVRAYQSALRSPPTVKRSPMFARASSVAGVVRSVSRSVSFMPARVSVAKSLLASSSTSINSNKLALLAASTAAPASVSVASRLFTNQPVRVFPAPSLRGRSALLPSAPSRSSLLPVNASSSRSILNRARGYYRFYTDRVPTLTAEEFSGLTLSSSDVVLDVRGADEREMFGYLKDSKHVPLQELLEDDMLAERYAGMRVYVLCHSGKRSEVAARCLRLVGVDALSISDGIVGFQALNAEAIAEHQAKQDALQQKSQSQAQSQTQKAAEEPAKPSA